MSEGAKGLFEVGVQHCRAGKIYTFVTTEESLKPGDRVIVEDEGADTTIAYIVSAPMPAEQAGDRKKVLRLATDDDLRRDEELQDAAVQHLAFCKERARARELPMKLVGARFAEDGKKLVFFFTADGRVDFRALVKELAQTLKLRIELRQIGARDGAKYAGCMGPCGRQTCCTDYMRSFRSISMGMAKNQGLSPNPLKLTGMCGKLQCCLSYEDELYVTMRKELPKVGERVKTPHGNGVINDVLIAADACFVKFDDGHGKVVKVSDLTVMTSEEAEQDAIRRQEARLEMQAAVERRAERMKGREAMKERGAGHAESSEKGGEKRSK